MAEWPEGPESRGIHLSLLVDVTGSMRGDRFQLLVTSLNAYLDELKKSLDDYTITIVFYDTYSDPNRTGMFPLRYELRDGAIPLSKIKPLAFKEYAGGGMTPTRDALIRITEDTLTFSNHQNPSRCLVVVFTDGDDNMSRSKASEVVRLVTKHRSEIFGFIGVIIGKGAWKSGENLGLPDDCFILCTDKGIETAVAAVASTTINYVKTGSTAISVKDKRKIAAAN